MRQRRSAVTGAVVVLAAFSAALLVVMLPAEGSRGEVSPRSGDSGMSVSALRSSSYERADSVAIQADGKVVVAGWRRLGGKYDFALARYTEDGSLDPNFGSGGKALMPGYGSSLSGVSAVANQADGKLVAAGSSYYNSNSDFMLARYTAAGNLDRSFGLGGRVLTDFGSGVTRVADAGATRTRSGVLVRWLTASESGNRGFNVYRERHGSRLRANRRLIARKGSARRGAAYSFLDRQAPGSTRRYWLQEVRRDGTRLWQGRITVS